jgi:hypothetical protein
MTFRVPSFLLFFDDPYQCPIILTRSVRSAPQDMCKTFYSEALGPGKIDVNVLYFNLSRQGP